MQNVTNIISDYRYAAVVAAVIGLVAKWLDNRLSGTDGTFLGYVKTMVYSGGLVAIWVYMISNPRQTIDVSRQFAAPMMM